ncbi:UCN3 protein, partial [Ptilonorhynchus violaceus]|nr:UCN3 protein [Ptilonorhynchus violaceus]
MLRPGLFLLLLLLLLGTTGNTRTLPDTSSLLGCLRSLHPEENSIPAPREEDAAAAAASDENLGKRTFPRDDRSKAAFRAHPKGKSQRSRAKVTLSLDVPTNLMNILFNIAKAKNLRAKAAANAHLMAQIGRRK